MKKTERSQIKELVKEVLDTELKSILHDVTYRLETLYSAQMNKMNDIMVKVNTRDLNLATHALDGYVVTDNSPSAGYVAWSDCSITYKGTTYALQNGNTNKKYIYWNFAATDKTLLVVTDTKPTLTEDDVLLFINDGGKHSTAIKTGAFTHGSAIITGSIDGNEIKQNAISSFQISNNAVGTSQIASGAITSTTIASGAIGTGQIAANAVTATQVASGAITDVKIASGAVTTTKIGSGAVGTGNIASGAVGTTQIAANAVNGTKIADGSISTGKIAENAVDSGKISNGAVVGAKIGAGAVATDKLNMAMHMLF